MTVKKSLHIQIWGRVQNVGFRAFVGQQAGLLSVNGWVRNFGRNQVEVRAEGHEASLQAFLDIVKEGPSVARVDRYEFEWGEFRDAFKSFHVRWL